jgi:integrase
LKTDKKHVAIAKLDRLVRTREEELAGLLPPKPLRDGALKPIVEHLVEHLAYLKSQGVTRKHLALTRNRILRLCGACSWRLLRDISADGFSGWAAKQTALGPKTRNAYLSHISGFLTWLESNGRIVHNCLKVVPKAETRGKERVSRRALTQPQITKLIQTEGGRGLVYFLAIYTGLRHCEIKALRWIDLHLDVPRPFVLVRAATTKNKKTAALPLVPDLAQGLRDLRAEQESTVGKVFRLGVPKAKTLRRDLGACEIPYQEELGRRMDYHGLRHTFDTLLHLWGLSPRAIMELMRQSDIRLSTQTYMDMTLLPLFSEMDKLPSPGASPKPEKTGLNVAKPVQTELGLISSKVVVTSDSGVPLTEDVPSWEKSRNGGEGGIRTHGTQGAHLISSRRREC